MPKLIKTKVKTYSNGDQQITVYQDPFMSHAGEETENARNNNMLRVADMTFEEHEKYKEEERQKKIWQIRTKVKDYCLENDFDTFWTITFATERHDNEQSFIKMQKWLKKMRAKYGRFNYILIPEPHNDGAIHFHGVFGGFKGVLKDSGVIHDGKVVYNCEDYKYGFTTVTKIADKKACANYITKYITKQMVESPVQKGKKKYWSSRGLRLPVVKYFDVNLCEGLTPDWTTPDKRVSIYNNCNT